MTTPPPNTHLVLQPAFRVLLGTFHGAWCAFDLVTDYAIGQFLKIPHEDTHILTAGMMWGRKARLLRDLIKRSDHPKKSELLGALNRIANEALRDKLAHSYIRSTTNQVMFIWRDAGQQYKTGHREFSLEDFHVHVKVFAQAAEAFQDALNTSNKDLDEFITAALNASNKETKSPE